MRAVAEALGSIGQRLASRQGACRPIGKGHAHLAYLAILDDGRRVVVRFHRQPPGPASPTRSRHLLDEYRATELYYQRGNDCWPGICPAGYAYRIRRGLAFTVEGYLGPTLSGQLDRMTLSDARQFGGQLGRFLARMHARPAPRRHLGALHWRGRSPLDVRSSLSAIHQQDREVLSAMLVSLHREIPASPQRWRELCGRLLDGQPRGPRRLSLVNGDATPSNLTVQASGQPGVIDPLPLVHFGARYLASVVFAFDLLVPALARRARPGESLRRFVRASRTIASACYSGYVGGGRASRDEMAREYLRWVVRSTFDLRRKALSDLADRTWAGRELKRHLDVLAHIRVPDGTDAAAEAVP
jgi:hypothetical protein